MFDTAPLGSVALAAADGPPSLDVTRYLTACLVVIGLLCVGAWFLSRMSRSAVVSKAKKRSLRVVDVLPLGRKQKLCVVRAYDRTFVLGVGEREVALVGEIDQEADLAVEALVEAKPRAGAFADLVRGIGDAARSAMRPAAKTRDDGGEPQREVAAARPAPVAAAKSGAKSAPKSATRRSNEEHLLEMIEERRAAAKSATRGSNAAAKAPAKPVAKGSASQVAARAARTADGEARPVRRRAVAKSEPARAERRAPAPAQNTETEGSQRSSWVG
ncbi:MAG: flagellar biosynthetic protein FliO [Planctomycetota bacterium]